VLTGHLLVNSRKKLNSFNNNFSNSDQDIKEAKLKVFSSVDRVESALEKGVKYFVRGISDEMRNEYRQRLLNVGRDDIVRVARDYLQEPLSKNQASKVIFGSSNNDLKSLADQGT